MGRIIDKFIKPDFSNADYVLDFTLELLGVVFFTLGLVLLVYLARKNAFYKKAGGLNFVFAFFFFTVESVMNFIDGNLIWFNETEPLFPYFFPAIQGFCKSFN